ncbi:MAG: glycosyltransferase [Lachnospiraceae bacterium]|nr:glycosyltransferase [Lachnospiraceae bacterium]
MTNEILVSILCMTYNHENYIKDTLEGFINQKTDFKYEIIVNDDASSDKTPQILKNYENKYSHFFFPIYQVENQYSKGVDIVVDILLPKARGKYIAFCEGDDYWIDEYKLQKQVNALETNLEVDGCVHRVKVVSEKNGTDIRFCAPENMDTIIPTSKVISEGGGYIGTCSIMYRKEVASYRFAFEDVINFDYTYQIKMSLKGGVIYLNDCMGVYRINTIGSWSSIITKDSEKAKIHLNKVLNMLIQLDQDTGNKYDFAIKCAIGRAYMEYFLREGRVLAVLKKEYYQYFKLLNLRVRIGYYKSATIIKIKRILGRLGFI